MSSLQAVPKEAHRDIFKTYFSYVGRNEAPTIFHRWSLISLIGALIGRDISLPFGHRHIYPNQYILLTGSPGARKGTAIGIGKNLLEKLEYKHISPNKAVKESFWKWMAGKSLYNQLADDMEDILDWDVDEEDTGVTEAYVAHDEFLDFIGIGDSAFITNLTNLWDNLDSFNQPKTRGKDVHISKPTISILSGITPGGISDTFKALASSGGFFSRILFIFSEPTSTKITFPDPPNKALEEELLEQLYNIQQLKGDIQITEEVHHILDRIYKESPGINDNRFQYYEQRRFIHLLKLIIILAAARASLIPTVEDCVKANTLLYLAEKRMPSALGEYGKGKFSEVANAIVALLNHTNKPLKLKNIWKHVSRDLNKFGDLKDIVDGLLTAEKIQKVTTDKGIMYIPNNQTIDPWSEDLIDFTLLEENEYDL